MAFKGRGMRRSSFSGRRGGGYKPSRVWLPLTGLPFSAITATTASALYGLQAPTVTIGTQLTADPPEDVTILRLMGQFSVSMSNASTWILGLTVQDTTWTPSATFALDGDKRFHWVQMYENSVAGTLAFRPPGFLETGAGIVGGDFRHASMFDLTPKVRVEAGKALYLVAYEESGAASLTVQMHTLRILYQQSGQRR